MNNLFTFSSGYLERWNPVNHQVIGSDVGKLGIFLYTRASFSVIIHLLKHTHTERDRNCVRLCVFNSLMNRTNAFTSLMFISGHTHTHSEKSDSVSSMTNDRWTENTAYKNQDNFISFIHSFFEAGKQTQTRVCVCTYVVWNISIEIRFSSHPPASARTEAT